MAELKVGQTVIFCPADSRNSPAEVTVTAIGRRWVSLANMGYGNARFDKGTMDVDGGEYSSPGRIFLSWDDFNAERERAELRKQLRTLANEYSNPYTLAQLRKAVRVLTNPKDEP